MMASRLQDDRCSGACHIHSFPFALRQQSYQEQVFHHSADSSYLFGSHQSPFGGSSIPSQCYKQTGNALMASLDPTPRSFRRGTQVKIEGEKTCIDLFTEEWQAIHGDQYRPATVASTSSFDTWDHYDDQNLTRMSPLTPTSSVYSGSGSTFDTTFDMMNRLDPPRSQPFLNFDDSLMPSRALRQSGLYASSSSSKPPLSVSPQAIFPYDSSYSEFSPSPVLSVQDSYESSEDLFSKFSGQVPISPGHPYFWQGDDTSTAGITSHWWAQQGTTYRPQAHSVPTSACASFQGSDDDLTSPHGKSLLTACLRNSPYAATDPGDEVRYNGSLDSKEREEQNRFLVRARLAGKSYREIRQLGNFREAESTLRGRFRDLTKRKHERVRKPLWTRRDVRLLTEIVDKLLDLSCYRGMTCRKNAVALENALSRVPWKKVSAHIADNGGTYRFGNATCKKKYMQVAGLM